MPSAILVLGAASPIGRKVSTELALQRHQFSRTAFLTHVAAAAAGAGEESRYATIDLDRVVGSFSDPNSYRGFDVVLSTTDEDDDGHSCAQQQTEYIDAAFAGGVRHFYTNECEPLDPNYICTVFKYPPQTAC
jgi:hypothetical protein